MKTIVFETVGKYNEVQVPVCVSVPFAKGNLCEAELDLCTIYDQTRSYVTQKKVVSRYPDGSIRYVLVCFLADFQANSNAVFKFGITDQATQTGPVVSLVSNPDGSLSLSTQTLDVVLSPAGKGLFSKIQYGILSLSSTDLEGLCLYDENGSKYTAEVGEDGWQVVESGPVRAIIRTRGRHVAEDGSSFMDYCCTLTFHAGSSVIRCAHQIINTEKSRIEKKNHLVLTNDQAGLKYDTAYPFEMLSGAEFKIHLPKKAGRKDILTSSFNTHADCVGPEETISRLISADTVVETANEMFPEVLFSVFAAHYEMPECSLTGSLYQAYQNFPKALMMDESSITLSLYPRQYSPLKLGQGVAKTLRFDLLFSPKGTSASELMDTLLMLEMGPCGACSTQDYIDAKVFGKEVSTLRHFPTERFLYRFIDSRAKGLGILNFGDCPEWEYVKQGRSKGVDIWINNEYDMPHNFAVMFARTGDRRYFDYMVAAVRHWMDVDFCHFSEEPYHKGLLYTHSVEHISGQPVPSHQWVEGFLDYYHLTGDMQGLETALEIGESLLSLIKLPIYNRPGQIEPREIGWALRALLSLYQETGEEKYLSACTPIVTTYVKWAELFGSWSSPYPENYLDRVPFMMHVGLVGLYSYYRLCGGEDVKKTLLVVINDILSECLDTRLNMFLGKQHPSIRYQNLNGMVLESLEIGYELTSDVNYLKKGLGMFSWITRENQPPIYDFSKIKRDDFTVIYNCPVGPKRCAQTLIPLLRYYTAAMEENLLPYED